METDRNLLFGVLALQADAITREQFVEACAAWAARKETPLADLIVEHGWMTGEERDAIDGLMRLKLRKHAGDARASLAAVAGDSARETLGQVPDPDVHQTVSQLFEPSGHVLISTIDRHREARDRYTLTRLHAQGGIGRVWLAHDADFGRDVALKELRPEQAGRPMLWNRFLEEARITGQLEHPGIVPVYELSRQDGDRNPFYTMRFVRGRTLTEAIRAYHKKRAESGVGPLDLQALLNAFLGVCHAVAYAHSRGVIHRDLKGQNVVLGDFGEVMVLDWGLAKVVGRPEEAADVAAGMRTVAPGPDEHEPTLDGQALGTPAYMPPEQAEGRLDLVDRRSDVYGLGAILYEILAGVPPFRGGDTAELLRRVVVEEPDRPRQHNPGAPAALEAVCLKALAKRPERRYAGAGELAEEVKRFLADEPVSVYREPLSTRVTRWGRRHRTAAASTGVLLVTAVVGLSVGAVLINRERAKAEASFRQARAAVDEYFTAVSESKLLDVPGLQPLRKELLDAALRYYRDFLRRRGGDRAVRAETAAASFRVGWINLIVGPPGEALEPLRTATRLYGELARAHPGVAEYRRLEATGHGALGLLYSRLDRGDEAMAAHRRALAIREALSRDRPGDPLIRADVARTHRNIGDLHRGVGKTAEALAEWDEAIATDRDLLRTALPRGDGRADLTGRSDPSAIVREDLSGALLDRAGLLRELSRNDDAAAAWREARDLLEGLVAERPAALALRARLAAGYSDDGLLRLDLGRSEEAGRSFRRGLEIVEGLRAANPQVVQYRVMATEGHLRLGWVLRLLGRAEEAQAAYGTSIAIAEGLVAGEPASAPFRGLLAQGFALSGNLLVEQGRAGEAVPRLRRALGIQEELVRSQPESVGYQGALAHALRGVGRAEAAAGHRAEARAAFERAGQLERTLAATYPSTRYNLACSLALLIPVSEPDRREALAAQALEALRQATAAGYANLESLEKDRDLDPLRPRGDFQAFLAGLSKKGSP